ncbi:homoserine kinase [Plasmopara halstedii]|uniref:Homoserine kinase n=1 Tax=Plasmopara halstedii TaxID=4781 RepID=A0A0P1AMZ4_PLAHL|nr:homoserine kinase [Plasmopara halstedii]CEG42462.1 homoserine kinase [Plasmopara halstedii]|eukprot:XP_024578831.1 homoserine kinase [Plasmopara halstedii]
MTGTNSVATQVAAVTAGAALAYYVGSRSKTMKRVTAQRRDVALAEAKAAALSTNLERRKLTSVVVRVPATTANMGPGFDTIGMALDIWTEISVEIVALKEGDTSNVRRITLTNEGEGAKELPTDESNLVIVGLKAAYKASGEEMPRHLKIHCKNRIPFARGLGSSSAGIVGGLIAGLALAGMRLPVHGQEELLQLASSIEGHPDNVAPAIYGGLQLGIFADDRWYSSRVQIPDGLQCVVFIPDSTGPTSVARAILPSTVPRKDAVFNIGRAAIFVNAFRSGNLNELRYATQDMLHQPQRGAAQYPHLEPLIKAALGAGAHGCFLSGAGPTVLAITSGRAGDIFTQQLAERQENKVANAMREAAAAMNVPGCVFITNPDHRGAFIVRAKPQFSDRSAARYEGDVADL